MSLAVRSMAKILKQNGYHREQKTFMKVTTWKWVKGYETVAWTDDKDSISHITHAAWQHYMDSLPKQEA